MKGPSSPSSDAMADNLRTSYSTIELSSAGRFPFWVVIRWRGFCVEDLRIVTSFSNRISFYFRRISFYFVRCFICVARPRGCDASPLLWAHNALRYSHSALRYEHDALRLYVDVVRSDAEVVHFRKIHTTFWAYSLIKNCKQTSKNALYEWQPKKETAQQTALL